MAFCRLGDQTGSIEVVVFPKVFSQSRSSWVTDHIVLVQGKVDDREEKLSVIADGVEEFDERFKDTNFQPQGKNHKDAELLIPQGTKPETLKRLSELLSQNPGEDELVLVFENEQNQAKKMKLPYTIDFSEELKKTIEELLLDNQ